MSESKIEGVFKVQFTWSDFESQPGELYAFPQKRTAHMQRYARAGVYRWIVLDKDGNADGLYIGEAEDFRRRLGDYLCPGNKKTAKRIHNWLQLSITEGKSIKFQSIQFGDFIINSRAYGCNSLNDPFARRVIENLAILDAYQENCPILNKGCNLIQKQLGKADQRFASLSREQKRAVVGMDFADMIAHLSAKKNTKRVSVTKGIPIGKKTF